MNAQKFEEISARVRDMKSAASPDWNKQWMKIVSAKIADIEATRSELLALGRLIRGRTSQVDIAIGDRFDGINDLGELQAMGSSYDRLCAVFREQVATLESLMSLLEER